MQVLGILSDLFARFDDLTALYEVHKITNFKTGPAFTFGGGGDRFGIGSAFAAVGP